MDQCAGYLARKPPTSTTPPSSSVGGRSRVPGAISIQGHRRAARRSRGPAHRGWRNQIGSSRGRIPDSG
jgi:hypothetical protein